MNKFKQKITACVKSNDFSATALTALIVAAAVFVNIIIYTLASHFGWYFTSKEEMDFSISNSGEQLFADAMDKGLTVKVTFCMYEDDLKKHDTGSFVYRTAKEFEKKYPSFIELDYINAITMLDSQGDPVELYKEDMRGKPVAINKTSVIFEYEISEGNTSYYVLTDNYTGVGFADFFTLDQSAAITSYEGEEVFSSMISWVLKDKDEHGTAYLTTGHGETAHVPLRYALIRAGYYCDAISDVINLRSNKIPEDADLIIISNPRTDFERAADGSGAVTEIERLASYVNNGGNLMVFLDPEAKKLPVLEGFISDYGIALAENDDGERLIVKDSANAITVDGFTLVANYSEDNDIASQMKQRTESFDGRVILKNAAPINLSGNAKPILISSSSSVAEAAGRTEDRAGEYTLAAYSTKKNSVGDDGRLFVASSIYLTATDAMITEGYSNKDFLYSLFDVYFGKGAMPYGTNSIIFDSGILENLTMGTAKWMTAAMLALPTAIGIFGAVVIIRRKNR